MNGSSTQLMELNSEKTENDNKCNAQVRSANKPCANLNFFIGKITLFYHLASSRSEPHNETKNCMESIIRKKS